MPEGATLKFGNEANEFKCFQCGRCCQISGFVRVEENEAKEIARYLGISLAELRQRYTTTMRLDGKDVEILRDHPGTTRCIFLDEKNRCIVHPVKPKQCRTFPLEWKTPGAHLYCAGLQAMRKKSA